MATKAKPLSFMERLSPQVSIYRPPASSLSSNTNNHGSPKLILLASWTDAIDSHIVKYIAKYQTVYPASQVLLIKSTTRVFFKPTRIPEVVAPAIPAIRACFPEPSSSTTPPELLIHIFSNGGSSSIASLYQAYAADAASATGGDQDPLLPAHTTIIDSAPSVYTAAEAVVFFTLGLSTIPRLLALPLIYAVTYTWGVLIATGWLGFRDWTRIWGDAHNDPLKNKEIRRTYIYSEKDGLINYKLVEQHADEAEAKGFEVRREKFVGSEHVAHARKDEGRYWDVVRTTWEGAVGG
ncbi:hypothetical protein B0H63DRAFT_390608 [Podospora didyma]|uniref:Indole-diterpene biosynthesis protein PaxU n=1 Tax=Podospora didyma TaxID=330526 RepID=A0AAE0NZQ7_9PEZI|nr:hypothetical protein B0H63DRAFT_390608 [Podospora didyma]